MIVLSKLLAIVTFFYTLAFIPYTYYFLARQYVCSCLVYVWQLVKPKRYPLITVLFNCGLSTNYFSTIVTMVLHLQMTGNLLHTVL